MNTNRTLLIILIICIFVLKTPSQIINGNFEAGRNNGWTEYSQGNYTLIATGSAFSSSEITPTVIPRSGNWMARIGGFSYDVNAIYQTITLPNYKPLYLSFFIQTRSASTSECGGLWVGAKTSIIINNQVISSGYLCQYNDLYQWTQYYVDMSSLSGQTVQVIFKAESANSVWSYLYIDDVSITTSTAIQEEVQPNQNSIELEQNYPNPFNKATNIKYSIPDEQFVTLNIFDFTGKELVTLVNEKKPAGTYELTWDASSFRNGIYFYKLTVGSSIIAKKLILLK
ncbi:MAG: T9SS type A sorting domain-containing protein [Paludibacter sp.]